MTGNPLRIAFLWHNHQPYYMKDGEFILPWLRLHAVKDYFDLPMLLNEFPQIKQTLNIVPSVFLQIDEYIKNNVQDSIQRLTFIPANELTYEERSQIIRLFFLCNEQNMIRPYSRYNQLFEKSKLENAVEIFTTQDWLDTQVWYNLTWLGEFTKKHPFAERLFLKASHFTETEKMLLLELHDDTMMMIIPLYKKLMQLGQIEISTTPYFHPILPLLIDFNSAKEANPANEDLSNSFAYPQDADYQIKTAIEGFQEKFMRKPSGLWCSEGSLSNETLGMLMENEIQWTATDESVLLASENMKTGLEKYFPRKFISNGKEITIFFRDHILSDKIGFQYSNWHPYDAASNFVYSLLDIRTTIIENYGEDALKFAVVPIILDGENCWEFYPKNGFDFLRLLYSQISENNLLQTCHFSELVNDNSNKFLPELNSIRAGSWINANFNIWAGHSEDIAAWEMLSKVRQIYEIKKEKLDREIRQQIYQKLMIAEGSDWFWWYGPEHKAPNKSDFDVLFRWHIKGIYEMLVEKVPDDVFIPIGSINPQNFKLPDNKIFQDDFLIKNRKAAGYYEFLQNFSTMHQTGKPNVSVYFGNDEENIFFEVENLTENSEDNQLEISLGNKILGINAGLDFPKFIFFKIQDTEFDFASGIIPVTLKLINLAEKTESIKRFDYKLL